MTSSSHPAQIKGTVLIARMHYIKDRGGQTAVNRILGALPAQDAALLAGSLWPVSWYPIEINFRLDEAIAEYFSPQDKAQVFVDMGIVSADENLREHQANYIDRKDPHYVLSRAPSIYKLYHTDGHLVYDRRSDYNAVMRTYDAAVVSYNDCLTTVGWYRRAIELSGGHNVRVKHPVCRARGGDHCAYECEWEPAPAA